MDEVPLMMSDSAFTDEGDYLFTAGRRKRGFTYWLTEGWRNACSRFVMYAYEKCRLWSVF